MWSGAPGQAQHGSSFLTPDPTRAGTLPRFVRAIGNDADGSDAEPSCPGSFVRRIRSALNRRSRSIERAECAPAPDL